MTIDEAIADNLRIAEGQGKCAEISVSEHAKERMKVCADEHRQLAEWLTELKDLREENKVLMSECDRLIKEKGELLSKVSGGDVLRICQLEEQLEKAKRLLQLAWDDIQTLNELTVDDEGGCLIEDKVESCTECPLYCGSDHICGWRYQVDALMLLGETNDEP